MGYDANWRGTVGIVNPTRGTGSIEELTRLLPPGIGLVVAANNIRHGTYDEFRTVLDSYKAQVKAFADDPDKVDVIHPAGTPPFMVLGFEQERQLVAEWEREFGIPVFTSGMNHERAMRALGVQRFVGIGYDFDDTGVVGSYFKAAGLDPVALKKLPGKWDDVGSVSPHTVYRLIKEVYLAHRKEAQGIYLQGSKWRILEIVETLENDLGCPVIHPVAARAWEIQRRLHVRVKQNGFGRLLSEMPVDDD
jgi:maleate cis-trans isomerase